MVLYAYKVPIYKKKYKEAGIHPNDIRGIKDITKLPFISRQDLSENFPDGIISSNFNREKGQVNIVVAVAQSQSAHILIFQLCFEEASLILEKIVFLI